MEPLADGTSGDEALQLSRRKLVIVGAAFAAVLVAVVVILLATRDSRPSPSEVATELENAIAELTPVKPSGGGVARFDTTALRARVEGALDGWYIDLAADSTATKVGVAARELDGGACVFAWSDVGRPRSALVTDPALPCVADIAIIPAKSPV